MTPKTHIRASKIHKWLALFIGAQLLLWFASGVIMSVVPIETVRSEHLVARESEQLKSLVGLVTPENLGREISGNVVSLRYRSALLLSLKMREVRHFFTMPKLASNVAK